MNDKEIHICGKSMEEIGNDLLKDNMTASVAGLTSEPLTAEKMIEGMNKCKRTIKHIYIMSSEAIPDDCYGILMLRPEDAKVWRENGTN